MRRLFLEHRLYEHGLLFRSLPGSYAYVVPHHAIDPDDFEIGGRRVHEGEGVRAGSDRRFRRCPLVLRRPTNRRSTSRFGYRSRPI